MNSGIANRVQTAILVTWGTAAGVLIGAQFIGTPGETNYVYVPEPNIVKEIVTLSPIPSWAPEPSEANTSSPQLSPEVPAFVTRQESETPVPTPLPISAPTVAPTALPAPAPIASPPTPICLVHGNGNGRHLGELKKC